MLTTTSAHRKDLNTSYSDLQHRHFATIAAIIRDIPCNEPKHDIALHFADRLARTNPKFDRKRFLAACNA